MQNLFKNDNGSNRAVTIDFSHLVDASEGSANTLNFTFPEIVAIDEVTSVSIRKADGTFNTSGLDVSFATNVLTVAASALAAGETVVGRVVGSINPNV